ncbi:hypothetical protein [Desulfosporosinus sp. BG]|uniref:hypothetical protein n=1 Tax=Desulfosporosinus sp. BG TaxID=1633135 RepID=UPI00083AFFCF|nr:hypothetical protein [Desulfosporosinus sp. BG]ODA41787.1 hypothetical protein DSBG_1504 [Desulfosporosinus sp. BG]
MSRCIVMSLVLIIGLGIGSIVPTAMSWWDNINRADSAFNSISSETTPSLDTLANGASPSVTYHFGLEDGVLSVIEGTPGVNGRVIVTGLNVQAWPKEMLDIAPKVEFYSLDEVQSFIDTVNEPLWQE